MGIKVSRKTTAKVVAEGVLMEDGILTEDAVGREVLLTTIGELLELAEFENNSKIKITINQISEED